MKKIIEAGITTSAPSAGAAIPPRWRGSLPLRWGGARRPSSTISSATPGSIAKLTSLNLSLHDRAPESGATGFDTQRFLFKGTVPRPNNLYPSTVYVKFVKRYGKEAHTLLASHKPPFAPQILFCAEVLSFVTMVIMDYLDSRGNHRDAEKGLAVLHAEDFVHGDLRAPNIVVQLHEKRVYFIDFDWADKEGKARNPPVLNPKINWISPADYLQFKAIRKHDDLYMLQQELADALKGRYVKAGTLRKRSVGSNEEDDGPSKRSRGDCTCRSPSPGKCSEAPASPRSGTPVQMKNTTNTTNTGTRGAA